MNGYSFKEKNNCLGRGKALDILARACKKQTIVKLSIVAALAIVGASNSAAFGQQNVRINAAPTMVASPWTAQDGTVATDINAPVRKVVKRSNNIRQTSAVVQDEMLAAPEYSDDDLLDPSADYMPSAMSDALVDPESESVGQAEAAYDNYEPEPLSVAPATTAAPAIPQARPQAQAQAPAAPKVLSTEVQNYPQSDALSSNSGNQGTFSSAASNAPRYSSNPYSRIGQAEYNPNQFYGGGGNYSVNGYRNTPPAEAYGQSVCGSGECGGYGCCGLFGGILQNTQVQAGAVSMRSPMDFEDSGNVGADVAINWGSAMPVLCGLNVQAGARGVFSDYYGSEVNGFSTDDSHNQVFWTAGVYFRSPSGVGGWSGGIVYDQLIERYYRRYDLSQLRAELSYDFSGCFEVGFRGAFGLNEKWCDFVKLDKDLSVEAKVTPSSYYTMFIRKRSVEGAEFTVYGGATEWSEGLIGASAEAPLSDSFSLKGSTTYVFPSERGLHDKTKEESWNISVGLSWYLGGNARGGNGCCGAQRPLFDVADNGSFLQNFLR